jgi:serine/threonine protein kinase
VVEWSSLKLLYEVDKGNIGTIWEASLDMAAGDGKVIAESLLSKGKAHLAAKVDGSVDAMATKDGEPETSARGGAPASDRMRSMMQPWGSPRARLHPTTTPLGLSEPLPPPAGKFARFARPVDAHADGLNARVLSEELVARQSHAALVEMTLALHALSPPERSHPNVLPILGIATNNGRRYALLTPKCTTSLQQLLHLAEQTLSLRLSLITEWNNVACGIADGLKFLHGQRIAHAALHPGNVLLDAQMRPQLADYGPSMCRLRATYARTKEGRMKLQRRDDDAQGAEPLAGSESNLYLSPEILPSVGTVHLWSAARALDLPSDLWALGCLVARLATLKPLYYKERPALYEALSLATADERAAAARECIATGMWRPAAQLEGEAFLPLGLLELVESCTSLEPAERPSSALVHSALEQLREEEEAEGASDGLELPVPVHPLAQAYVTAASGSSLPDVSLPEPPALPPPRPGFDFSLLGASFRDLTESVSRRIAGDNSNRGLISPSDSDRAQGAARAAAGAGASVMGQNVPEASRIRI